MVQGLPVIENRKLPQISSRHASRRARELSLASSSARSGVGAMRGLFFAFALYLILALAGYGFYRLWHWL